MAQRRTDLVEAALRVMRREGASTMTTRAVAAEADVPHGSVHYAFSGKAPLLQAVMAADTNSAAQLFTTVAAEGGSPAEVLDRAFRGYIDRLVADPETELVMQELTLMGARDPALTPLVADWNAAYRINLARLLDELATRHARTWDAPVRVIVEQLLGVLFGCTVSWLVDRDEALLRATLTDAARVAATRLR